MDLLHLPVCWRWAARQNQVEFRQNAATCTVPTSPCKPSAVLTNMIVVEAGSGAAWASLVAHCSMQAHQFPPQPVLLPVGAYGLCVSVHMCRVAWDRGTGPTDTTHLGGWQSLQVLHNQPCKKKLAEHCSTPEPACRRGRISTISV